MRRDLRAVLDTFVATHRGVRVGRLFGAPAVFAGRRVFAKLDNEGLRLRLPTASEVSSPPSGAQRRSLRPSTNAQGVLSSVEGRKAKPSGGPSGGPVRRGPKGEGGRPALSDWITVTPGSPAAARLEMLLEQSARYVALS